MNKYYYLLEDNKNNVVGYIGYKEESFNKDTSNLKPFYNINGEDNLYYLDSDLIINRDTLIDIKYKKRLITEANFNKLNINKTLHFVNFIKRQLNSIYKVNEVFDFFDCKTKTEINRFFKKYYPYINNEEDKKYTLDNLKGRKQFIIEIINCFNKNIDNNDINNVNNVIKTLLIKDIKLFEKFLSLVF